MNRKILRKKWYLYVTEFFAGMSVMAVELGASRLLAPYFSSSQIVWTIIIGTIMIAMALGNLYGGRSADRDPNPDRLYRRMLIAAVWIAAIPAVGRYGILGISAIVIFTVNASYLVWAAFAACMLLFVFPLFLLGTVTPSLVKYTMEDVGTGGSVVGRLGAANTIGSIIGTFVPTFVTIPSVGTSVTFLIFAGILLAIALLYYASGREQKAGAEGGRTGGEVSRTVVSLLLFAAACWFGHSDRFAFWESDLAYEGESVYNYLQVKEDDRSVVLSTNVLFGVQSVYRKDGGLTGMYYDYALAAPLMAREDLLEPDSLPLRVLILGMGTGTYATQLREYFPNVEITGVEIDQGITDLAVEYFRLSEDVPVYTYDGRAYLNAVDAVYDVIMVDAYQDITIPFQMASVEFFELARGHLGENGVLVVNMNMRSDAPGNANEYLADTIASVFPVVYTVDVAGNTNRELFAGTGGTLQGLLERNCERLREEDAEPEDRQRQIALGNLMAYVAEELVSYEAGEHRMTDDRAPVELLSMQMIDDLIAEEVVYYREVYAQKGVQGLAESLF